MMMRYRKWIVLVSISTLYGCNTSEKKKPLSAETMQTLVLNSVLIESSNMHLQGLPSWKDSLKLKVQASYAALYEQLSITPKQVSESHGYYTRHPQEYIDILNGVLDSLNTLKEKYPPKEPEE